MKKFCTDLARWSTAAARWLVEPWQAWGAILTVSIATTVALTVKTEPTIRICGLVLQLLGILTVAWGIRETRLLFDRPNILSLARQWIGKRPRFRPRPAYISADIKLPGLEVYGRMSTWQADKPNSTLEERINVVEKNLLYLRTEVIDVRKEIDEKHREFSEQFREEGKIRAREDELIMKKLEAAGTGGLSISAIGGLWLFAGVCLSTLSLEISKWLK